MTSTSWLDIDGDPNHDADTGIFNGFNYRCSLGAIQRMRKRANSTNVAGLVALADICCLRVLLVHPFIHSIRSIHSQNNLL